MILILNDTEAFPKRTIGAYRIATALRDYGLEVEVIDFISKWPFNDLLKYINSFDNLEWVGISTKFTQPHPAYTTETAKVALFTILPLAHERELIKTIKSKNVPIVLGGPTADFVRPFLEDSVDYVLRGYADQAVIAVHENIVNGAPLTHTVEGFFKFVDCDENYKNIDLSNIRTFYHESDFIKQKELFPLEIGRGCIFSCAFCNFTHIGKKPGTYFKDKESIKAEIVDRYTKYGSTTFAFLDDTFNDSIDKMNMLVEIRRETGIPFQFWAYCRLDVLSAQEKQVNLINDLGWTSMTFGVETFDRESGRAVGKGADPEKLKDFMIELREKYPNIAFEINIIVGLPNDTEESIRYTVDWFLEHPEVGQPNLIPLSIYNVNDHYKRKITSKISKNPNKYGYDVIPIRLKGGGESINLNWKTKSLNNVRARELAGELRSLFTKENARVLPNLAFYSQINIMEDYVLKKFASRNIL